MTLPLSKDIISAFTKYQKNAMTMKLGPSKFSLTMTLGGNQGGKQEYGTIPDQLKALREEAINPKLDLSNRLLKVKDYISRLSAFNKYLKEGSTISWSWHSFISPKQKDKYVPNIDLEKAMMLLPIAIGMLSEIGSIANHKEPILTGNSIQNHAIDEIIFKQIILKYLTVKEILAYIISLNLNDTNIPELSSSFLKGLLYYVRGFQFLFVGFLTYYNHPSNIFLQSYLSENLTFDNGSLAKLFSTSSTYFYKSSIEFQALLKKNVIDSKIMIDLFLHIYYEGWSYLLYGFPSLNLFNFNTSQPQSFEQIPYSFSVINASPQCCSYLITYINKSFSYVDLLKKEKKYSVFKDICEYFIKLTESIKRAGIYMTFNNYYDSTIKCDDLTDYNEINKVVQPLYIYEMYIENNEFYGPVINIPSKFVEKWKAKYTHPIDIYQSTMSTMFPDFC